MTRAAWFKCGGVLALCMALALTGSLSGCSDDNLSDGTPPAAISDLAAVPSGFSSVRLTWTAPGDNGTDGQAYRYRTVFATNSRTLDIINFCGPGILAMSDKTPKQAGQPETLEVKNLTAGQTYYFKVQTEDEAFNVSISNQVTQALTATNPPVPHWEFLGDAFDGVILRLATVGNEIVAVGPFTKVGGLTTARAARWDGTAWQRMDQGLPTINASADTGITGLTLRAVTTFQGRPAICGGLTRKVGTTDKSYAYIATWNGASWDSLNTRGAPGDVYDLITYDNALVVAGTFVRMDTLANVGGVARWDGTQWRRIGPQSTFTTPAFVSLATDGGALIAAGSFDSTTTVRSKRIAAWNGSSWSAWAASDPSGSIFTTTFFQGKLLAGGNFGLRQIPQGGLADTLASNIKKMDCSTSSANALLVLNNQLIVGGNFNQAGPVPALSLANWSGTTWTSLGRHQNLGVSALTTYDGKLTVSSGFASSDGLTSPIRVAIWTP